VRHKANRRRKQRVATRPTGPTRREVADGPFVPDGTLVTSVALLAGLGIVMNYSTTAALAIGDPVPPLALRHFTGCAFALLCAALAARLPLSFWERVALPCYFTTIVLLVATPFLGVAANGAQRWLAVPGLPIAIQPAEPARFATVLALAALLAGATERGRPRPQALRPALTLLVAPSLLLLLQPDLGSAIVLITIAGLVLFASGIALHRLLLPGLVASAAAGLYIWMRPYALARVLAFLDPWRHANDAGFQLVQSFVAFGRGSAFGVGLGDGRQKLFYLPEAHTDFILSVVAEELGLVGVLLVLGSFAAIALAGLRVARRARDPFALLVATGMTALLVLPALVNAAVVMGLAPTTGLTLPFLSHGSNSLVCSAVALGVLLRIAAREAPAPEARVRGAQPRGWANA
jgi:cell division protein FtsW